ncbi:hypothetical protein V1264_001121 [Littorina saxatilis]|uniref:Transmembrane protein n=1 Tax=Littorina saxatilis TaxID=31220 RepID=A0AAN9C1A1_9CAEN
MNTSLMNSSLWNDTTTALVTHNGHTEGYDGVTTAMTTPVTPEAGLTLTERLFLLTKTQRQETEDALLYVRYVIFVVALPLTLCNVAVFLQPAMRGATAVFVIGLSLAQLLYVITNIIGRVMAAVIDDYFNDYTYLVYRWVLNYI